MQLLCLNVVAPSAEWALRRHGIADRGQYHLCVCVCVVRMTILLPVAQMFRREEYTPVGSEDQSERETL